MHPRSLRRVMLRPSRDSFLRRSKNKHKLSPNISKHVNNRPRTRSISKLTPDNCPRPHRRAATTNRYTFRYLQTGNPSRLEENDLKRALNASLQDTKLGSRSKGSRNGANSKSNDNNNPNSVAGGNKNSTTANSQVASRVATRSFCRSQQQQQPQQYLGDEPSPSASINNDGPEREGQSRLKQNKLCNSIPGGHQLQQYTENTTRSDCSGSQCGNTSTTSQSSVSNEPISSAASIPSRYRPVAKKQIYQDADFFHEGIMEYIEYALLIAQRT